MKYSVSVFVPVIPVMRRDGGLLMVLGDVGQEGGGCCL